MKAKKSKSANRPYWFYCELYHHNFYFCPAFTREELAAAIFNNFQLDYPIGDCAAGGSCIVVEMDDGRAGTFIWVDDPKQLDVLVHECVHAANDLLNKRGIRFDADNDEPYAYYVQYLFNKCREFLLK